jgi:hypothetical protein
MSGVLCIVACLMVFIAGRAAWAGGDPDSVRDGSKGILLCLATGFAVLALVLAYLGGRISA